MSRRLRPSLPAALLVVVGLLAGTPGVARADSQASVEDVQVKDGTIRAVVSVQDVPSGAELAEESLEVTVDGQRVDASVQPLSSTNSALPRRVVMLAIDTSGSMQGDGINQARRAATDFAAAVPKDVEVGLITFADRARLVLRPTRDRARLLAAVGALRAEGDTALYDAVTLSLDTLGAQGERTLIVLSDGADTTSTITRRQAGAALRRAGVQARFVAFRTQGAETAVLQGFAARPGGLLRAQDGDQLAGAFAAVADAFDTQFAVSAPVPAALSAGAHDIRVRAALGPVRVDRSGPFKVTEAGARSAPDAGGSLTASTSPALLVALLAVVFAGLLALGLAVLAPARPTTSARRTHDLEMYTLSGSPSRTVSAEQAPAHGSIAGGVLGLSDRLVQSRGWHDRIALKLDRAQVPLRPHEWLVVRVCASLAAAALLLLLMNPMVGAVLGALSGLGATALYLRLKTRKRLRAFEQGLPDTLQLVASSLQTGFSLPQALDSVVRDGRQPMGGELGRALAEARLGAPLEDSLDRVADRMESQDFRWTVMAIRIQRQVGGNLAEVLQTTVKTMRERAAVRRQVSTLSAEGRLSAYILVALPVGLFAYLFAFRRPYLSLLWTEPAGLMMSFGGIVGMVLGSLWMRKVVRVEV